MDKELPSRSDAQAIAESWLSYYGKWSEVEEIEGVFLVMVKEPFESTATIMERIPYKVE